MQMLSIVSSYSVVSGIDNMPSYLRAATKNRRDIFVTLTALFFWALLRSLAFKTLSALLRLKESQLSLDWYYRGPIHAQIKRKL